MALEEIMKSFIEKIRADLRWFGYGGEGPWVKLWQYPLYALLGVVYVVLFAWRNTIGRLGDFFR